MQRILIIDDDPQIRALISQMLERAGYEVMIAENGESGCRMYRESPADLIITDMVMPEKSGVETILELTEDFPDVKIIGMSGGGRIGPYSHLKMAERVGAERIFPKPVSKDKMLAAVKDLLGGA